MFKLSNKWILLIIITFAAILRFFSYSEIPFVQDEFSALFRLKFNDFATLINEGVKVDGHPAGIHVLLYYWTKVFGVSSMAVKFPFIVFGVLAVYFTYLIGKLWFNETVGLLSSATVTALQYTVIYSQIARPYISGLLFSLMMVYYLTKLIQKPEKNFLLNGSLFIISGTLCAYNHHFSLLFAAIVGISGLILIQRKFILKYILLGLLIFVLYVPHLNIFFYQLKVAGVEEWLSKPKPDFLIKYLYYIFNFSYLFILTVLGISIGYKLFGKSSKINYKTYLLFFTWFILPLGIGYLYSVNVNAVLQYSVLIFSFTFIILLIYGHIPIRSPKFNLLLVSIVLTVGVSSLVFERKHYTYFYQSNFSKLLEDYKEVNEKNKSVLSIIQSKKKINNYYSEKLNIDSNYIWFDDLGSLNDFKAFLDYNSVKYEKLYLGSLSNIDPLVVPTIQMFYPTIETQNDYFGGTTYLFSKKTNNKAISILDFESIEKEGWSYHSIPFEDSNINSDNKVYLIETSEEWGPGFNESLNNIKENNYNFIDISVKAKAEQSFNGALLVISLEANEKSIYWIGQNLDNQIGTGYEINEWNTFHASLKLSDIYLNYKNIKLKTLIWNKGNGQFLIDDFKIELRQGNPIIYGINNKIPFSK